MQLLKVSSVFMAIALMLGLMFSDLAKATNTPTNGGTNVGIGINNSNDNHLSAGAKSDSRASADANANSVAAASAAAKQTQTAVGGQGGNATGGSAVAQGGAGGAGGDARQGQSQSADNAGNSQNITIQGARQIASLSQGSWAAPECGAGGNAGGSGSRGAGFLGVYWTPADCKLMSIAYTWAHLGMYGEACKTLTATKTLRGAYKRYDLPLPDCATIIAALTAEAVERPHLLPIPAEQVTPEDIQRLDQKIDRVFKQTLSK